MKQSQLFTKTKKEAPKDEVSVNAQLLIRAGYVDKLMAGVYSFLPLGFRVIKKIENIIREEMDAIGGQEILMPALHPKKIWETTGRWSSMEDLYKIKDASGREFALGPTHEEIIVPLAQKYINSRKDIPFAAYQIQTKFRMELRAKSGILRGREFIMKDLYSFHTNEKDLDEYYEKVKNSYIKIFKRVGLGNHTHLTFASGGSFSRYSHEFQTLAVSGEDIIHICENCKIAINREIKNEIENCPECGGNKFDEQKAIEVGNIFKLKDKYSKPFNLKVPNEEGKMTSVIMSCFGIGINRIMGAVVETHYDEKGIVWPEEIAPFQIHLISLNQNKKAEEIYKKLTENGIEVLFDDRDASPGEKFADSDLMGFPCRIVISNRSLENGGFEVKKRNENEMVIMNENNLLKLDSYANMNISKKIRGTLKNEN